MSAPKEVPIGEQVRNYILRGGRQPDIKLGNWLEAQQGFASLVNNGELGLDTDPSPEAKRYLRLAKVGVVTKIPPAYHPRLRFEQIGDELERVIIDPQKSDIQSAYNEELRRGITNERIVTHQYGKMR